MSRLKPFFGGLTPPAVGTQVQPGVGGPAQLKQLQMLEQDVEPLTSSLMFVSKESIDASIQGGDAAAGSVLCWHPYFPVLAVATNAAIVEYDAVSGCRRNMVDCDGIPVKLQYSFDGSYIVLLTRERNIFAWSTKTWRKETLLIAPPKYADRPLVSGMLAVSAGASPVVYYSPMGKKTLRTVHTSLPSLGKGEKREKELLPGHKLKTENKKPLVGLASDPTEESVVYVLSVEGELMACRVAGGMLVPMGQCSVPFVATQERVKVHSKLHPLNPRYTLIFVEAERSGISVVESTSLGDMKVLTTLKTGTGGVISGFGLVRNNWTIIAAAKQARGNVGFFAWKMFASKSGMVFTPCNASPSSLWSVLQGDAGPGGSSQNIADVSGDSLVAGAVIHEETGMMAFWTTNAQQLGVSHFRIPVLSTVDVSNSGGGYGTPSCLPMHSSPDFWIQGTNQHDSMTSQLYLPRMLYLSTDEKVFSYDLAHGLLSGHMAPNLSTGSTQQVLLRCAHSNKKSLWLSFSTIISPSKPDLPFATGTCMFTAVPDKDVAVSPGSWWFPGRDGTFVGSRDELTAILSNSGSSVAVFDTTKLAQHGVKGMLYVSKFEEGRISRLFPGPPSRIPGVPKPRPEIKEDTENDETDEEEEAAMQEWESYEAKRVEVPKRMLVLTVTNKLCLVDVSQSGSIYHQSSKVLSSRNFCQLPSAIVQVGWQTLVDPFDEFHEGMDGADQASPCLLAILLCDRVMILSDKLDVVCTAFIPADSGNPTSCLWIGASLLVSTSANHLFYVSMEGTLSHAASLMMGPPAVLLAAQGDRIILTYKSKAGAAESATRAWDPMPMMLLGWAQLSSKGILPGGHSRAERAIKRLLSSYDATKIPVEILDKLASHGFSTLAAAAATVSELDSISDIRKAILEAAAGNWAPITQKILFEYENSEYYPDHPSDGSPLYLKLVTLGRACELHGHFKHARDLFEAAGAWSELFSLCIFQGDFAGLQMYASRGGREAQLLSHHLLAVNEDAFRRSVSTGNPKFGGRPFIDDWDLKRQKTSKDELDSNDLLQEEQVDEMEAFDLGPIDRLPFMEASLKVDEDAVASGKVSLEHDEEEDKGEPIGILDRTKLESYIGIPGAVLRPNTILEKEKVSAEPERAITGFESDIDFDDNESSGLGAIQRVITGAAGPASETATETSLTASVDKIKDTKSPQRQTKDEFRRSVNLIDHDDDDDFFSSDDESTQFGGKSASSFAAATTSKFLFTIKSKDDVEEEDTGSLKSAAQSLTLGNVTKTSFKKQLSMRNSEIEQLSKSSSQSSLDNALSSFSGMNIGREDSAQPVKDPFTDLTDLRPSIASNDSRSDITEHEELATAPELPEDMFGGSQPMKPELAPQLPKSDLLAGWDEFEALFSFAADGVNPMKENEQVADVVDSSMMAIDTTSVPTVLDTSDGLATADQPHEAFMEPPKPARKSHENATKSFKSYQWSKATANFSKSFFATSNLTGQDVDNFRRQCAKEYASSFLLQKADSSTSVTAARLARHAAALTLQPAMQVIAKFHAAELNIKARNFGWAGDTLSSMMVTLNENENLQKLIKERALKQNLAQCDEQGSQNESIRSDEDMSSFEMIIEVSQTLQEIEDIVAELCL